MFIELRKEENVKNRSVIKEFIPSQSGFLRRGYTKLDLN
jgi:hypothetical protein